MSPLQQPFPATTTPLRAVSADGHVLLDGPGIVHVLSPDAARATASALTGAADAADAASGGEDERRGGADAPSA
jgi:hypothetical protein